VSTVSSAIEQAPAGTPQEPASRPGPGLLVLCCYLFGALVLTGRLWIHPAGRMQIGDAQDVNLFAWYLRYSATAVSHGHLPALFTTAINAPRGVNMMWNTAFLLPGVLLTPVTLLAGPQVSLTIVLTLSIAGSAASLYWVLRRWGAGIGGAALGGAVYGFSPAMLNSATGHYQLVLAAAPPLIIDCVLQIVTGRGRPVRTGIWLGLLTAAQIFTGEELLIYTAVAALVLVLVLAVSRPRAVPGRIRDTALGAATAVAVTLLISGYALWFQFLGPLHEHKTLSGPGWSGNLAFFVDPSVNLFFHTPSSAAVVNSYSLGLPEVLAYLGWPLIVVLLAAAILFWRDMRVRAAAVACALLELCNLGGGPLTVGRFRVPGSFLPYHWLQGLPTMAQVLPDRFCILGAGAAGAVLAFSLDAARSKEGRAGLWRSGVPVTVAVLAVLPLIPLPYQAARVPAVPPGWQAAFSRLRLGPDDSVLVIPVTLIANSEVMRWQADTGEPASMVAGYVLRASPTGEAVFNIGPQQSAAEWLNELWAGRARVRGSSAALVRAALAYWRPSAILAVTWPRSRLARFITSLIGRPAFRVGKVVVWRL